MGPKAGASDDRTDSDGIEGLLDKLDELTDLFRRRLVDDKDKRRLIDSIQRELEVAKRGPFFEIQFPLVRSLFSVIDRVDAYEGPDADFVSSVGEELVEALRRIGVDEVETAGVVDPAYHEIHIAQGRDNEGIWAVADVLRRGFRFHDRLLRPARVVARRDQAPKGDGGRGVVE